MDKKLKLFYDREADILQIVLLHTIASLQRI